MKNGSVKIAKRKFSQFDTSQTLETAFGNIGRADLRVEGESNHATRNLRQSKAVQKLLRFNYVPSLSQSQPLAFGLGCMCIELVCRNKQYDKFVLMVVGSLMTTSYRTAKTSTQIPYRPSRRGLDNGLAMTFFTQLLKLVSIFNGPKMVHSLS